MRVVFIGQFPPPFDPITLNNLSVVEQSQSRGDVCKIINVSQENSEIPQNLPSWLWGVFVEALQADALHFLTRGYDRKSVFTLFLISFVGKLLRRQTFLTIQPELFCFLGPLRSRHVGKPLFRLCFWLLDVVYCNGEDVAATVKDLGCPADKIVTKSLTIPRPEEATAVPTLVDFIATKKTILALFATPECTYLLKESQIFISHLKRQYPGDFGLVVCADGDATLGRDTFSGDDVYQLDTLTVEDTSFVLSRATMVLRPLQCMGAVFMPDDAFMLEWPARKDEYTVDFNTGLAFIRKGKGLHGNHQPQLLMSLANLPEKSVANIVLNHNPHNALLIGTFSTPIHEETLWNEKIRSELESAGVACETISLAEAPFDSNKAISFFSFLKELDQQIKRHDCVLYMTQGYTRPSLLLLLAIAVIGKLWRRKRVYVLFHRDLFSFLGRMRSRNAGLPLLFTSFSLIDGILASKEGCAVAEQYVNAPDKFHEVRPTFPKYRENGACLIPPQFMIQKSDNGVLCNQFIQESYRVSGRSIFAVNGFCQGIHDEIERQIYTYQTSRWIIRPLQCNGEIIGGDTACLIESPAIFADDSSCSSGAIVVRKGNAQVGDVAKILIEDVVENTIV